MVDFTWSLQIKEIFKLMCLLLSCMNVDIYASSHIYILFNSLFMLCIASSHMYIFFHLIASESCILHSQLNVIVHTDFIYSTLMRAFMIEIMRCIISITIR